MQLGSAVLEKTSASTSEATVASPISYLPFLDGLRAISILLVLGFHQLGPVTGWIGGQLNGWVGVDLFFIISGYLISSILLKEQEKKGTFSLKNFYVRRWLRICPAYYTFLLFMLGFMLFRGGSDFSAFAMAGLYLTNIDMCASWGLIPATTGLLHSWSLSVEEQFYLLWPGAMKLSGKRAFAVCMFVLVAAYLWRFYLASTGASWLRLSVGLDTKLDSIMLGVAVAFLWRSEMWRNKLMLIKSSLAQCFIGVALLVACHFLGHPATETNQVLFWGVKLPVVLMLMVALLVSLLANQTSRLAAVLSSKPMIWVGRLSYSLYLWHVIVNFPCTDGIFQALCHHKRYLVELAKYATCIGFASASYYWVEQPFLKLKGKFS